MTYNYTSLTPFKKYIIQNFPFIDGDFDALTNYELYCKIVNYLNKLIDSNNNQDTQIESLTDAFNTLQTYVDEYFENLDVQEEINTKLDDMVTSGDLQEIFSNIYTSLQNQINSLASGSPIAVSSVDEMEDTSKIYVNTTNGYWYYYDTTNTTWTQGGVYQASVDTEDVTKLITINKNNSKYLGDIELTERGSFNRTK